MTRFFWHIDEGTDFICQNVLRLDFYNQSELLIPDMKSINILDMAKHLYPNKSIHILHSTTHNEKTHEELYPGGSSEDFVVPAAAHPGLQRWIKENRK